MQANYTDVIFDLDGTLIDSRDGIIICIRNALATLHRTPHPYHDLSWVIGPPLRESFKILLETSQEQILEEAVSTYRQCFKRIGVQTTTLYPGIKELLSSLKEFNLRVHLATSKGMPFLTDILEYHSIRQFFTSVYGATLDDSLSHKKDILGKLLAEQMGRYSRAIMIGDRAEDIRAAQKHGIPFLAVSYGIGTQQEIEGAGAEPNTIAHSAQEILRAIYPQPS